MRELEIKNVKTAQYRDFNLNQIYDYIGKSEQSFEFQRSEIGSKYRSVDGTNRIRIIIENFLHNLFN